MEVVPLSAELKQHLISNATACRCTVPLIENALRTSDIKPYDVLTFITRSGERIMIRMFHAAESDQHAVRKFTEYVSRSCNMNLCFVKVLPEQRFLDDLVNDFVMTKNCTKTQYAFVSRVV